uniref:Uncharacterized protein n=1 Tax=viral metagenome TaxID=1070528 RepID=A0A6C0HIR0_9ZZZZ
MTTPTTTINFKPNSLYPITIPITETMTSITKAFIPRILGNVSVSQICNAFAAKQIGKVNHIDIHRRINEKNNQYSFAFLELELYDTEEAIALCEDIQENGLCKVFYDRKNYWEVKAFLPRSERASSIATETDTAGLNSPEPAEEEHSEIQNICDQLRTPPFDSEQVWRKSYMHGHLLHRCQFREMEKKLCYNCGGHSDSKYDTTIFWKNYAFCGGWCQIDAATSIRDNWRHHEIQRNNLSSVKCANARPTSKFLEMFQHIQDEADTEMQIIQSICRELMKRPSVFTAEDLSEMEREYDELYNITMIAKSM